MASIPKKDLTGAQRNAYQAVLHLMRSYGLGSLAPKIMHYIRNGYAGDTVTLLLQDTPEYKRRFAANDARRKKGLPVLSPAEYLATETQYRQVLRAAGVPEGFYNQQKDFESFLSNDVSPAELQGRVEAAQKVVDSTDPAERAKFRQWYTRGDMIAYALDPKRAAPLVQRRFQAAELGAAAESHGLAVSRGQAEHLADIGVDEGAAEQGFAAIASEEPNVNFLADISGEDGFTTADLLGETFEADQGVTERRRKLAGREKGRFSGSSGVGQDSLSTGNTSL